MLLISRIRKVFNHFGSPLFASHCAVSRAVWVKTSAERVHRAGVPLAAEPQRSRCMTWADGCEARPAGRVPAATPALNPG